MNLAIIRNLFSAPGGHHHRERTFAWDQREATRGPVESWEPAPDCRSDKYGKRVLACALLSVLGAIAVVATLLAVSAGAAESPAGKVCAAFRTWDHHRTTANIDAMTAGTFGGSGWTQDPGKYVLSDAASLYADVRTGAKASYIASDVKYMGEDCGA
jgi:hypothetical protein